MFLFLLQIIIQRIYHIISVVQNSLRSSAWSYAHKFVDKDDTYNTSLMCTATGFQN